MFKMIFFIVFTALTSHAFAGGCIVLNNLTATSGSAYTTCQAYLNQVTCDANPTCKWNPTQYFQNNCSGQIAFEAPCPTGTNEISFNAGTDSNPKFKCCKAPSNPGNGQNQCCNPAGNPVSAMSPCPTPSEPFRCCNPAGNPVAPMMASVNNCKGGFGKGKPVINMKKK